MPLFLKLPSLFLAWTFWTFHNKSHNMKALVILNHSWSPFLPLTCLYGKNELLWSFGVFLRGKLLPDHPCKSHDHNHQWADLMMAWLPQDKKENVNIKLLDLYDSLIGYILFSTCHWVHMALAVNKPNILLM